MYIRIWILYRIIGYGLRGVMREFPGKARTKFGLDNLIMKKTEYMSKRKHGDDGVACRDCRALCV